MEVCLKLDNIKRENRPYAEVSFSILCSKLEVYVDIALSCSLILLRFGDLRLRYIAEYLMKYLQQK